jgi:hypothetical protein
MDYDEVHLFQVVALDGIEYMIGKLLYMEIILSEGISHLSVLVWREEGLLQ